MIEPLTQRQQDLIVTNVLKAVTDITKLNSTGYKFIGLASGFIAHYNLSGFIDYYDTNSLMRDILQNQRYNQWQNFNPSDSDYAYYMGKKEVYNRIVEGIGQVVNTKFAYYNFA